MYDITKNKFREFDSVEDLLTEYAKQTPFNWSRNPTATVKRLREGDVSLVSEASKLIDKLEAEIETTGPIWEGDVHGPVVSIPRYLANVPTQFLNRKSVANESHPVRIFVNIVSSGGINGAALQTRGVAIMALVLQLQKSRPVEVILLSEANGGSNYDVSYSIRLESNPISLAHCVNALSDQYVARDITYSIHKSQGWDGGWPNGAPMAKPTPAHKMWRNEIFRITEQDLVLEAPFLHDEVVTNPLGWLQKSLDKFTSIEEGN